MDGEQRNSLSSVESALQVVYEAWRVVLRAVAEFAQLWRDLVDSLARLASRFTSPESTPPT